MINSGSSGVKSSAPSGECDENELERVLNKLFPNPTKGKNTRMRITEAAAIAHYHQDHENNVVNILIDDDAPQFKLLTSFLGLCWIHAGGHFKKLDPIVPKMERERKSEDRM